MANRTEDLFLPVLLGGHRGSYSLARSFFEAYGVKSVVVSRYRTGPISHSRILETVLQRDIREPEQFKGVTAEIERRFPHIRKIIIASDDVYLGYLLENRESLPSEWIVPYAETRVCRLLADKASFYELCRQAEVAYPQTTLLMGEEKIPQETVCYPVILKPAASSSYETTHFPGKKKVYFCQDESELMANAYLIRKHGYHENLIVQEYIPGPDTQQGVLTVYISPETQEVKLHSFAKVLVDDPTPAGKGNSLALYVCQEDSLLEPVRRVARISGFSGFATIDVKFDERKGKYCFLDWNVRLGSSHYYVTASGNNVAVCYGADYLGGDWKNNQSDEKRELLYSLLPERLLLDVLTDPGLKYQAERLKKEGKAYQPLWAPYDRSLPRWGYVKLSEYNFYRKLGRTPLAFPLSLRKKFRKPKELAGQES